LAFVSQIGLYLAAALAGLGFVVQQAVNASLRGALDSPFWAALANFAVGTVAMLAVLLALREPVPSLQAIARAPWYAWTGGLLGVVYIAGSIVLIPRIGAATVVALIVVGQLLGSLAFDHFGLLGVPVHEINGLRGLGAGLLIAGVVLICLF